MTSEEAAICGCCCSKVWGSQAAAHRVFGAEGSTPAPIRRAQRFGSQRRRDERIVQTWAGRAVLAGQHRSHSLSH